jgi:tetratricopeptide (TPR) repeat protein
MRRAIILPISIIILYVSTMPLNYYFQHNIIRTNEERDIIERIFGGLRGVIGDWAFMKAEEYHHRGLPFLKAMAYHENESPFAATEEHHHEEGPGAAPARKDLFQKIYSAVKVTEDSHLKSAEEKEALPWFYVEVAFDPNDIRGYVLGGYWLQRMNKPLESMDFLKKGLKANPTSAAISAAIGNLYFKTGKSDDAIAYLDKARKLWAAGQYPNNAKDNYSMSDRYFALDLLGSLYEKEGRRAEALKVYEEVFDVQPNKAMLEKITKLRRQL